MNWNTLTDFVAMGGYGLYVWGAFGMAALSMAGEMLALRARRAALLADEAGTEPMFDYREGAA